MSAHAAPQEPRQDMTIDVLAGSPTEHELAALIAVVTEAYVEEASQATADESLARSAWSISQRALRTPLPRELGWARSAF